MVVGEARVPLRKSQKWKTLGRTVVAKRESFRKFRFRMVHNLRSEYQVAQSHIDSQRNRLALTPTWLQIHSICSSYQCYHTVVRTLAFLYQVNRGFSPFFVSVSSKYAHLLKNSSCESTLVSLPVMALYMSSITWKSVGNRMSKYPWCTFSSN